MQKLSRLPLVSFPLGNKKILIPPPYRQLIKESIDTSASQDLCSSAATSHLTNCSQKLLVFNCVKAIHPPQIF